MKVLFSSLLRLAASGPMIVVAGFSLHCSSDSTPAPELQSGPWQVVARLEPRSKELPDAVGEGTCAVGKDLRRSQGCAQAHVLLDRKVPVVDQASVEVDLKIPWKLRGVPLLIEPRFTSRGDLAFKGGAPSVIVPTNRLQAIRFGVPEEARGAKTRIRVVAWKLPSGRLAIETASSRVPAAAQLVVDYGIYSLAVAAGVGPVRMWIEAAADGRTLTLMNEVVDPQEGNLGWKQARIDLSELAGGDWSFHFYSEPAGVGAVADSDGAAKPPGPRAPETDSDGLRGIASGFSFPLWGSPRIMARAPSAQQRNIILISLDTLRADHLEKVMAEKPLMPNLIARAAEGMVFEDAIAPYPSTTGSHMSLFTSLYPSVHEVGFPTHRLAAGIPTLPELLAAEGYVTGAVTDNGMLSRGSGFSRGFDEYREHRDRRADYEGAIVRSVDDAVRFVQQHRDDRFFLFLHTYQVHTPFAPPKKYDVFRRGSSPRSADGLVGLYAGEVRYTDEVLASLFREISALSLESDTVVVVTSDHGEAFGEHGAWGHSMSLYEEEIRIPLLWWGPGLIPASARVDVPVSLVDLPPTLLELVGADEMRWSQGRSLAPLIRGEAAPKGTERFAENLRKQPMKGSVAVRDARHKWIQRGGEEAALEVYDLIEDPLEKEPLDDLELIARGQAMIQIFDEENAELRKAIAVAGTGEAAPENTLDSETVERLRELGYVE